ncbi:hypothetical protein NHQ30_002449 [Ciborinia camelliae]|nr:hypothetical protein NHQ30_002449 [Ciborinia camelliae]
MATLTRLFMPLLPFKLMSSPLPDQKDTYRYTFPLADYVSSQEWPNNLTLVFWSHEYYMDLDEVGLRSFRYNLRPLLDPTWGDEMESQLKGGKFDASREDGLIVWSTIELDIEAREYAVYLARSSKNYATDQLYKPASAGVPPRGT